MKNRALSTNSGMRRANIVAAGVLGALIVVAVLTNQIHRGQNTLLGIVSPVQGTLNRGASGVAGTWLALQQLQQLQRQNGQQAKTIAQLRSQVARQNDQIYRDNQLLQQYGHTPQHQTILAANVIGVDPSGLFQYVTVDEGSDGGVRNGMSVLDDGFLVGRVVSLGGNWSKVLLLSDPSSSVDVIVEDANSRAPGVLNGNVQGPLQLTYVPQGANLRVGQDVVTSGMGDIYPEGLPIGVVAAVYDSNTALFESADIAPEVDMSHLENVAILTSFVPASPWGGAAP